LNRYFLSYISYSYVLLLPKALPLNLLEIGLKCRECLACKVSSFLPCLSVGRQASEPSIVPYTTPHTNTSTIFLLYTFHKNISWNICVRGQNHHKKYV
jgi:hypothetical protein